MDIPERLQCLFSGEIEERNGSYVLTVPDQERELGNLQANETYRVAILPTAEPDVTTTSVSDRQSEAPPQPEASSQSAPITEGEHRTVEIEDIGEQGDGIARVDRGFVVIVPDTEQHEQVDIKITDVGETVAFGEVVNRISHVS